MDELERRLRSALTEMAEEVPPSHNAWAEQERRLALKSRRAKRRPALIVAAAAAVALILVPVLVLRSKTSTVDQADTPPPTTTTGPPSESMVYPVPGTPEYRPVPGETIITLPAPVASNRDNVTTYVYTVSKDSKPAMCFSDAPTTRGAVIEGSQRRSACIALTPPRPGKYVWLQYGMSNQKEQGLYIYIASDPTDNILIRRAEGGYTSAYKLSSGKDFSIFVSYLNSPKPPAAWTARDKANAPLENGG